MKEPITALIAPAPGARDSDDGEAKITLPTLIRVRARARWRPLRCFCGAVCVHARWLSPISGGIGVPRLSRPRPERIPVVKDIIICAPLDRYLSIEALMKYSGLSRRTLMKFMTLNPSDALPHYRTPKRIVVRVSEFDQWMQQFKRQGRPRVEAALRELGLMRDAPTIITDEMLKPRKQPPGSPVD